MVNAELPPWRGWSLQSQSAELDLVQLRPLGPAYLPLRLSPSPTHSYSWAAPLQVASSSGPGERVTVASQRVLGFSDTFRPSTHEPLIHTLNKNSLHVFLYTEEMQLSAFVPAVLLHRVAGPLWLQHEIWEPQTCQSKSCDIKYSHKLASGIIGSPVYSNLLHCQDSPGHCEDGKGGRFYVQCRLLRISKTHVHLD